MSGRIPDDVISIANAPSDYYDEGVDTDRNREIGVLIPENELSSPPA